METRKLKIIIEKTKDMYSAYAENEGVGIFTGGDTVDEVKKEVKVVISLLKEHNSEENIPDILKGEYEIVYQFDAESLLNYYKGIFTNAAFERMTGINQKQLQHYSTGLKKPRPHTKKKIENSLHKLGEELLAIEL